MPEGPDAALAARVDALGVLPAENFVAQRGAKNANHTVDRGGDERDLDAARPRKIRETRVVMSARRCFGGFRDDFFGGILRGIGKSSAG